VGFEEIAHSLFLAVDVPLLLCGVTRVEGTVGLVPPPRGDHFVILDHKLFVRFSCIIVLEVIAEVVSTEIHVVAHEFRLEDDHFVVHPLHLDVLYEVLDRRGGEQLCPVEGPRSQFAEEGFLVVAQYGQVDLLVAHLSNK